MNSIVNWTKGLGIMYVLLAVKKMGVDPMSISSDNSSDEIAPPESPMRQAKPNQLAQPQSATSKLQFS